MKKWPYSMELLASCCPVIQKKVPDVENGFVFVFGYIQVAASISYESLGFIASQTLQNKNEFFKTLDFNIDFF